MRRKKICPFEKAYSKEMKTSHADMGVNLERCPGCNEKIGLSWDEKLQAKVDAVPKEDKQKFLDAMHDGKNLGEARIIAGIDDVLTASRILCDNIVSYEFISKTLIK